MKGCFRSTCIALLVYSGIATGSAMGQESWSREDPTKVVAAEACGECHVSEYEVWKKTPHATGFKTLHRKESAEAIAQRMGFPLIKRESMCLNCHFTTVSKNDQLRAVSGVSCESCHGAAKDWLDVHNDYGRGFDHKTETAEHRAARIQRSRDAGMRRPSDLYAVAANCYSCHTVPNEKLVDVGRHSVGSNGFELVKWSQGEIRHNFLKSFLDGDGTTNAEDSDQRLRVMYVVGRALDLEYSLRGIAEASASKIYLKAMQRRLRNAVSEVRAIAGQGSVDEARQMLTAVADTQARPGRRDELLRVADRIGSLTRRFLERHDGTQLASLDPLRRGEIDASDFDPPEPDEEVAIAEASSSDGAVPAVATPDGGSSATAGTATTNTTTSTAADPGIPAAGKVKTRLRKASSFDTISAGACQSCHGDENAWWFEDPHFAAVEPFLERAAKNTKIARLYGIKPSRMARGSNVCMDCHGTIVTGKEKRQVQDGVSCQSCHGPAKDFLEPHQEGEKSQGTSRPGYVAALKIGMNELKNLNVRAETCTGCHYINDARLISSGHPSGRDFDYVAGMAQVDHWQAPVESAGALKPAFQAAIQRRGAVPEVRLARLPSRATSSGTAASGTAGLDTAAGQFADSGTASDSRARRPRPARPRALTPRPVDRRSIPAAEDVGAVDLSSFPEISEEATVEDLLSAVQQRIETLYRAVEQRQNGGGR